MAPKSRHATPARWEERHCPLVCFIVLCVVLHSPHHHYRSQYYHNHLHLHQVSITITRQIMMDMGTMMVLTIISTIITIMITITIMMMIPMMLLLLVIIMTMIIILLHCLESGNMVEVNIMFFCALLLTSWNYYTVLYVLTVQSARMFVWWSSIPFSIILSQAGADMIEVLCVCPFQTIALFE